MGRAQLAVSALLLVVLLGACTPENVPLAAPAPQPPAPKAAPATAGVVLPTAPARPAWEIEWDSTVEAAKKEGTLMAATQFGPGVNRPMAEALKSRFGLDSQWLAGNSSELGVRIMAERRAGIHSIDVAIIGHVTPYTVLRPAGALESLDKALFLPEVADPQAIQKIWRFGELQWVVDKEHTMLVMTLSIGVPMGINTQLVKTGEIKSYRDLLNPKWKGKIVMYDPTIGSGFGTTWAQAIGSEIMGWDYLRQLVEQEPMLTRDRRLSTEWVARGKYAVGVALVQEVMREFIDLGAPLARLMPEERSYIGSSGGVIILLKEAPHPNAAKLFINWLLTKEGQTVFSKAAAVASGRLDVSTEGLDPLSVPDPKGRYSKSYTEKWIQGQTEALTLTREIFGKLQK